MKKIVAIIRQEKYQDVKNALSAVGIGGINEENDSVFYEASQNLLDGELKKYTSQIVQRIKRRKVYDTIDIGKESTCA